MNAAYLIGKPARSISLAAESDSQTWFLGARPIILPIRHSILPPKWGVPTGSINNRVRYQQCGGVTGPSANSPGGG